MSPRRISVTATSTNASFVPSATGLSVFNDIITREAFARGLPLIDLRLVVTADEDYANDVEPSVKGGAKIAKVIATLVTTDDFTQKRSVVFAG